MRILVVEDERKIATFIQKGLRECGFVVDIVHRGDAARYRVEDLTLDLATRIVRRGNRPIELTTREFSLLECLMRALGNVFTRTQLCQRVSISLTDIGSFALFRIPTREWKSQKSMKAAFLNGFIARIRVARPQRSVQGLD